MKTNLINRLIQNRARIAKALYLAAAVIEQLPESVTDRLPKVIRGVIVATQRLNDKPRRKRR